MSTRPVPRRESPWGLPEGDTRQPVAHRCNDRAEDVIQALFEGNPLKKFRALSSSSGNACDLSPASSSDDPRLHFEVHRVQLQRMIEHRADRNMTREEPTEPFYYLQLDPPKRKRPN